MEDGGWRMEDGRLMIDDDGDGDGDGGGGGDQIYDKN